MSTTDRSEKFLPTATIDLLNKRAAIVRQLRTFFDSRGFIEVETPILSADTVIDRHLHPVSVPRSAVTGRRSDEGQRLFLQTSPEFGMKRLLAAGAPAIYQICKSFRQGESGEAHNPEFSMLEWYRVGDDMPAAMDLLADLTQEVLTTAPANRMSYREAFLKFAHIDPFTTTNQALAQASGLGEDVDRDEHLNLILASTVEACLGQDAPTIIFDYPATQAALATVRTEGKFQYAERFEIYVDGVELANGYHELLDAAELQRRNQTTNQQRLNDGAQALPSGSYLLSAMISGLPACAGVALGVDRLVMLSEGYQRIDQVIPFPIDRA